MHVEPQQPSADPQRRRTVGREHRQLRAFLGTWKLTGRTSHSPTMTGELEYELMPGAFFLRGRWDYRFDGGAHIGTSILGYDPESGRLFAHNYDNLGFARDYTLAAHDRTWSFTGPFERAFYTFSPDGDTLLATWEFSKDGRRWDPLCQFKAHRR